MIRLKNIYDGNRHLNLNLNLQRSNGVHIIGLYRSSHHSSLRFFPAKSGNQIILKEVWHKEGIGSIYMGWTYFSLTDEEVERMIVPRII